MKPMGPDCTKLSDRQSCKKILKIVPQMLDARMTQIK